MASGDEFFGSLGGSLMKDLLADLQVDDNDFSLEQLEKELSQLDHGPNSQGSKQIPAFDAASLIVSHAQDQATGSSNLASMPAPTNQGGMDAWSLSLQNFTAMALQDDFLAADSARKQQHQPSQNAALEEAEDYDIKEKATLAPPPGLGTSSQAKDTSISQRNQAASAVPAAKKVSPIPPRGKDDVKVSEPVVVPPTAAIPPQSQGKQVPFAPPAAAIPPHSQPPIAMAPPIAAIPPQAFGQVQGMPPFGVIPPHGQMHHPGTQGHPMPGPPPQMMIVQGQPAMGTPVNGVGPAWQGQPPRAHVPPAQVYCNPNPNAPPIPATALASTFMTARDIAFVVHAILKPVLIAGVSEDDYHIQFLRRLGAPRNSSSNGEDRQDPNKEMTSRANRTKEWASEKGVLGVVSKTNIARPRALISTPLAVEGQDNEQKQRASLWKARVYIDQAYQAYMAVVDAWKTAPPGSVPPQVQVPLVKLMKCMGLTQMKNDYQLERANVDILMKLAKGQTLVSRVLEQALLPPNAVQTLLPALFDSQLGVSQSRKAATDEKIADRVFRAIALVIQKLNLSTPSMLKCLEYAQIRGKDALGTPAKMQCVHSILQKGSMVAKQDPSTENKALWEKAETGFMSMLQTF